MLRNLFKIFNNKTIVNTILNYHVIIFLNVLELKLKLLIMIIIYLIIVECTSDCRVINII